MSLRMYAIWQKDRWIFGVLLFLGLIPPAINIVSLRYFPRISMAQSSPKSTIIRPFRFWLHLYHLQDAPNWLTSLPHLPHCKSLVYHTHQISQTEGYFCPAVSSIWRLWVVHC